MSLKLCTDALLMDLAPVQRIASVSYLSREKAALAFWPVAARLPVNHNSPEEVLATHPDLVLTDTFTSPAMRAALAKSGARVVEVPAAQSFDQIRAVTRQVAQALGEEARGEALIAAFSRLDAFEQAPLDAALRQVAEERGVKAGSLIHASRVAVTGRGVSPGLFEVLELLGRERTLERMKQASRVIPA